MKRSEMVELIWNFVQNVEHDYDIYMEKDDCNNLLKKIEKAGMVPPSFKPTCDCSFDERCYICRSNPRHEWEPEND